MGFLDNTGLSRLWSKINSKIDSKIFTYFTPTYIYSGSTTIKGVSFPKNVYVGENSSYAHVLTLSGGISQYRDGTTSYSNLYGDGMQDGCIDVVQTIDNSNSLEASVMWEEQFDWGEMCYFSTTEARVCDGQDVLHTGNSAAVAVTSDGSSTPSASLYGLWAY